MSDFSTTEIAVVIAAVAMLKEMARTEPDRAQMPAGIRDWDDVQFDALIGKLVMTLGGAK